MLAKILLIAVVMGVPAMCRDGLRWLRSRRSGSR
jgi:hypothetical protein